MNLENLELKYKGRSFNDLTIDEISGILNTAMDDGEWHTPSARDINIKEQTRFCVYGWCNISKHNTYHDKEIWFNINQDTVQIWVKEYIKGGVDKSLYRTIHNIYQLGFILNILKPVKEEEMPVEIQSK